MRYLPHTQEDIAGMLAAVGASSLDALFEVIPPESRRETPLNLPPPMTEWELAKHIEGLAEQGGPTGRSLSARVHRPTIFRLLFPTSPAAVNF